MTKTTINHPIKSKFLAQKLAVSNERARQLIKEVKVKLGYDVITIGEFLQHIERPLPNSETWFD